MLMRTKISLNKISTDAACELIRNALNKGVNVKEVYVDTVGKPETYRELLERNFPHTGIQFTVTAKADSLYPVVSAASIVAKVNRDRVVKNWIFDENEKKEIFNTDFGCGYPSDPITKKWMQSNSDPVFGYPNIVRFSWKTTTNLMKDKSKKIKWENYEEEDDEEAAKIRTPFNAKNNSTSDNKVKKKKFNYLEENKIVLTNLNFLK
jgi:ribonuclease H2 subunit A